MGLRWTGTIGQHRTQHHQQNAVKQEKDITLNEYSGQSWVNAEGKDLLSFILDALFTPGPVWVDLIIGLIVVSGAGYWLPDIEGHAFYCSEVGKR